MSRNRDVLTIVGFSLCVKLLLIWTYRSTDFEVHRNWLAITHSLPLKQWYTEATSQWTLDYPPLFAYFEYFLSLFAAKVDPKMLQIQSLNYASDETVLFQRFSVIFTDFVLIYAAVVWHNILYQQTHRLPRLFQPTILVGLILNPGMFIVDHMHFQYNGILMGIMLLSMARIYQGQVLLGSFWFSVLLNMKHIYLYIAPAFFVYLLSSYVLVVPTWKLRFFRLTKLGTVVSAVFVVSFGPFIYYGQLGQLASRLFPLQRGLVHAYWAPNLWAFYAGFDKFVSLFASRFGYRVGVHSLSSGLVQEAKFATLPNVPSVLTLVLALVLMLPELFQLFRKPSPNGFLRSVIYCGFTSFVVGFHVHEKAILIPLLCLLPLSVLSTNSAGIFVVLSSVAHYSLFPLIFTVEEQFIKVVLVILYGGYMTEAMQILHKRKLLSGIGKLYVLGFVPLFIYAELGWQKLTPRLEFMPLMATSLYCAFGVLCSYLRFFVSSHETSIRSQEVKNQ